MSEDRKQRTSPSRRRLGLPTARLLEVMRAGYSKYEGPGLGTLALSLATVLLSWNIPFLDPSDPGGDHDYWYLIGLARDRHMDFGSDVSTTYGPLFFLTAPSISHPLHVVLAIGAWLVFGTFASAALLQLQPGRWQWLLAAALGCSFAATPLSAVITATPILIVLLAAADSAGRLPRWMRQAFPAFAAVAVAALALNKFSAAGLAGAAALAALIVRPRGERVLALTSFIGVGIASGVSFWLAVGQPIQSLFTYVIRAISVGAGQSGAMGLELKTSAWEYPFAALGAAVLVFFLIAVRPAAGVVLNAAWALLMLVSFWLFFKQGFVRHDSHSAQFFALVAAVALFVGYLKRSRALAALAVVALAVQIASYGQSVASVDPAQRISALGRGVVDSLDRSARRDRLADAREELQKSIRLPKELATRIGARSVYVEPFNYALGYAYHLQDAVLPTLLEYGAYNRSLDEVNAAWFANSTSAPDFILRRQTAFTLDGRNPLWDSPNAKIQEVCWYKVAAAESGWLLLERRSGSACGPESPAAQQDLSSGAPVMVAPSAQALTVVRVQPRQSVGQRLGAFLFKPEPLEVAVGGTEYRLPWGHAGSPLIVAGYDYSSGTATEAPITVSSDVDADLSVSTIPFDSAAP